MRIDANKERRYGKAALDYVKLYGQKQLPTIKPGMPEWTAWQQYFADHLGFLPLIMQRIEDGIGSGEMTVPADRPEQFDASYAAAIELKQKLDERVAS